MILVELLNFLGLIVKVIGHIKIICKKDSRKRERTNKSEKLKKLKKSKNNKKEKRNKLRSYMLNMCKYSII
jgi:hypothetical protein